MTLDLVLRPEALDEIADAATWYEERSAGLSAEFFRALDAAIASVRRNPLQYPAIRGDLRRVLLRRFPYSLIFTASGEEVIVLGCVHWRQDPRRWHGRR